MLYLFLHRMLLMTKQHLGVKPTEVRIICACMCVCYYDIVCATVIVCVCMQGAATSPYTSGTKFLPSSRRIMQFQDQMQPEPGV